MSVHTKDHPQKEITSSELKQEILRSYELKKKAGGFKVIREDRINDPIINRLMRYTKNPI
jgi:hypothetical protein